MLKRMRRRKASRQAAAALYLAVVERARSAALYSGGGVPDTLDGRFELIALHAFVVLRRLQAEPQRTGDLAQSLFDEMFDDMDRCLREMGSGDLGVGRRVKFMASSFLGRIRAYGQGLDGDDETLRGALLRNLYGTVPAPPDGAAAMARYLRDQIAALEDQPLHELMQGRVRFGADFALPATANRA